MENISSESIAARLYAIEERINNAAERALRNPDDISLVAVSKTFPPEIIDEGIRAGISILGESKIQEAMAKHEQCSSADWHFIGRLQRNKIRHALSIFSAIHSLDSLQLMESIARVQDETGQRPQLFLQVNVSGEASKTGFSPEGARETLTNFPRLISELNIVGLMTIPPWAPEAEASRPYFRTLRELRDSISSELEIDLPELSMGMSGDFEVAIEEGATFVRIGSAIFGKRSSWKPQRTPDSDDYF